MNRASKCQCLTAIAHHGSNCLSVPRIPFGILARKRKQSCAFAPGSRERANEAHITVSHTRAYPMPGKCSSIEED